MKRLLFLAALGLVATSLVAADADPQSEIKAAARKLADKPNYSWTSTPRSEGNLPFRVSPTEGKSEKGGWMFATLTFNDTKVEMAFKGDKSAIKRDDDNWQTAEELEGGDQAWIARRLKTFKAPAGEAEEIVELIKGLKKGDGGVYSGDLTEEGAKALFVRGGRRAGQGPADAKGSAKFWLKDGTLTKYEFNLQGTIKRDNDEDLKINRTTTVEIKDVGATKVAVPDEAKKKLS
jgi:hypothetical protein